MKKLAEKVLNTVKEIINREISLEEVSNYKDVVFTLNAVAIECCGVSKRSQYPLIDLVNEGHMPTLQEVERVISKLFKSYTPFDLLSVINYQLLIYKKTSDIDQLICLLKYYDRQEKNSMVHMAFLEVFKKIACVEPRILGVIGRLPIGWQVEIKLATILTLIEGKCPLFYFYFDQDLDRRGIDFVICGISVQIKFENAIKEYPSKIISIWNIPAHLITHKEIVEWLEKATGQSIYNRLPFETCKLIDKVLRY